MRAGKAAEASDGWCALKVELIRACPAVDWHSRAVQARPSLCCQPTPAPPASLEAHRSSKFGFIVRGRPARQEGMGEGRGHGMAQGAQGQGRRQPALASPGWRPCCASMWTQPELQAPPCCQDARRAQGRAGGREGQRAVLRTKGVGEEALRGQLAHVGAHAHAAAALQVPALLDGDTC